MYMVTKEFQKLDASGGSAGFACSRPSSAADALRTAIEALDRGFGIEILDLTTGAIISLAELKKAADSPDS